MGNAPWINRTWIVTLAGFACLLCGFLLFFGLPGLTGDPDSGARKQLRTRLSRISDAPRPFCRREQLCGSQVLSELYENRKYRPVWVDERGLLPQARSLVDFIQQADQEGLKPDVYNLSMLEPMLAAMEMPWTGDEAPDPEALAELDLMLTDAFLIYGSHLLTGRVHPESIHTRWDVASRQRDLAGILVSAMKEEDRISNELENLLPAQPGYRALKNGLEGYREITRQGGWKGLPSGPTLHPGDREDRVAVLRERLVVSGDGVPAAEEVVDPSLFDPDLEQAVKRFQERHGLLPDGIVGKATLEALNVPAEKRVRQIELNLERWRWMPEDLGERHILVNTADFGLEVVEDGKPVRTMKVIAGKKARRTPVFSGRITYLVFNPYWNIPHKIAVRDLLPRIRKDPGILKREKIQILESWKPDAPEIDPEEIDWSTVTTRNFAYRLRQEPGSHNALGRIKFIFPNKFAVYLHDTPAHHLFSIRRRSFSSGCIRIEDPFALAEYLMGPDSPWNRDRILKAVDSGEKQEVILPVPVPVHVLYWTAWVDEKGRVQFREDIYGRDRSLDDALKEGSPGRRVPETPPAGSTVVTHQNRTRPTSTWTN